MRAPSIITLLEKIGSNRLPRRNSLIPQIILPAAKHVTSINNLQSAKWKQQKKELDYSAVATSWRKERTRLDTTANEEKTTRLDPSCIKDSVSDWATEIRVCWSPFYIVLPPFYQSRGISVRTRYNDSCNITKRLGPYAPIMCRSIDIRGWGRNGERRDVHAPAIDEANKR